MARRPSFQFYPADWLGNANLKRCTAEQQGIWMNVMCLMHDSPTEYGILRWTLEEIALAVHCKVSALEALVKRGVLKGAGPGETCEAFTYTPRSGRRDGAPVLLVKPQSGPLWFSSRMVKDEYVRQNAGASTRFGAIHKAESDIPPPDVSSPAPSPSRRVGEGQGEGQGEYRGVVQGDGSSSSSSSSSSSLKKEKEFPGGNSCPETALPPHGLPVEPVLFSLPCVKGKAYHVTQAMLDHWKATFPEVDPQAEARTMAFWLEGNPARRKTLPGMGKFVSGWLGRAQDKYRNAKTAQIGNPSNQRKSQMVEDYLTTNPDFFRGADDDPS